jgi:hypothetical protein
MGKKSRKKHPQHEPQVTPGKLISSDSRYLYWGFLTAMILLTAIIRLRLLDVPLERDEGEFAYMGQLILQGIPPYDIAYNMKLPGIYAAYALILLVFGQSAAGIHLGLLVVNTATILLMYLLGQRLFDRFVGLISACSFAVLSLNPTLYGNSAHATHFVLLPALAGILLLLVSVESRKSSLLFWSGILLGLAFLMKQPGVFFILFSLLFLVHASRISPDSSLPSLLQQGCLFLSGALIPFALTCLVFYLLGVFDKFWFWTVSYALEYGTQTPVSQGLRLLVHNFSNVIGHFSLFWILAVAGAGFLFWNKTDNHRIPFVVGFSLFSFLAVCPGLYFREHYFVLLLPAASLLIGIGLDGARELLRSRQPWLRALPAILFAAILLHAFFMHRAYFFQWTPYQACRAVYSLNPFPESIVIADYIKKHSREGERIAVIGSEPQIYFYANRHAATGHIYTYALMETHPYARQMQKEMIEEVEKANPEFLVFVDVPTSWFIRPGSEKTIFVWIDEYSKKEYDLEGVIDIFPGNNTHYRWGDEARSSPPQSPNYLLVFKKKTGPSRG